MTGPKSFDLNEVSDVPQPGNLDAAERAERLSSLQQGWSLTSWLAAALLLLFAVLTLASSWMTFQALWASNKVLGGAIGSTAALAFTLLVIWIVRELTAIWGLRRAAQTQALAFRAVEQRDDALAARAVTALVRQAAVSTAQAGAGADFARAEAKSRFDLAEPDSITPLEKLDIFERTVVKAADDAARARIVAAARDSAIFTAVSPFASLDVAISLWRNLRMIREIAQVYGLAPGWRQTAVLLRRALFHGVVAGGMEAGDGLLNNLLGRGIAGQLSAKLGEGMVNGLMTARVGLATIDQCRPLPFAALSRPKLTEIGAQVAKQVTAQLAGSVTRSPARSNSQPDPMRKPPTQSQSRPVRDTGQDQGPTTLDAGQVRPIPPLD